MSVYYRTLYAWKCKGTHHKLAMEALPLLSCEDADEWSNLFLRYIEQYLTGSKDPDTKFKDFRNHVLHVRENNWGGAIKATQEWYGKARQQFADAQWAQAVYSAGVMSHYLTDVFCPLHTAQKATENNMHRACEWSVSCSYDALMEQFQMGDTVFPRIEISPGEDWLQELILEEANRSNSWYDRLVTEYDFAAGVKKPETGLTEDLSRLMSETLGRAAASLAVVLDRCLREAGQKPPLVALSMHALLSQMTIPVFWVTKKMADAQERALVQRIYDELQQTGTVVKNLTEEDRVTHELWKQESATSEQIAADELATAQSIAAVEQRKEAEQAAKQKPEKEPAPPKQKVKIKIPAEAAVVTEEPAGGPLDPFAAEATGYGARSAPQEHLSAVASEDDGAEEVYATFDKDGGEADRKRPRRYLHFDSPIVDAPSIGPKTASRFQQIQVHKVHDLLTTDAFTLCDKLKTRWITTDLLIAWQQQAELMCSVPGLRGHDAQLLQGGGVENYLDLADSSVDDLLALVSEFAQSSEGQRIIRSGKQPDWEEVNFWIENARWAASNQAA